MEEADCALSLVGDVAALAEEKDVRCDDRRDGNTWGDCKRVESERERSASGVKNAYRWKR